MYNFVSEILSFQTWLSPNWTNSSLDYLESESKISMYKTTTDKHVQPLSEKLINPFMQKGCY